MTNFSLAYLFSGITLLALGTAVLIKDPKKPANRAYVLWTAATVIWQFAWMFLLSTTDLSKAYLLFRVGYVGVIFIPVTYYHLVVELLEMREKRRLVWANYLVGTLFVATLWLSDYFFIGHYQYSWGYYPKAGLIHSIFLLNLFILAGLGILYPYQRSKKFPDEPVKTRRMRFITFANIFFCLGAVDFLMKYGVNIYPSGFLAVLFAAAAFAAFHFHVLDLNFLFRQTTIRLTFVALLAAPLTFLIWATGSTLVAYIAVAFAAFLGPKMFVNLHPAIMRWVDRLPPFKGRYEPLQDISALNNHMDGVHNVDEWAWKLTEIFGRAFQPSSIAVLLFDPSLNYFHIKAGAGLIPSQRAFLCVMPEDLLVNKLMAGKPLVRDMIGLDNSSNEATTLVNEMDFLRGSLCVPIFEGSALTGIVSLGNREGPLIYNPLEVDSAQKIAFHAGRVLQSIRAAATQDGMTAVLVHDLLKPFGEKGSFKQMDKILKGAMGAVPPAVHNTLTQISSDAYVVHRFLRDLAKGGRASKQNIRVRPIGESFKRIERKFAGTMAEKSIRWTVAIPPDDVKVLYEDESLEFRVLANLVDNAIRHTPKGGRIDLHFAIDGPWFVATLKDTGPGISPADAKHVFERGFQGTSNAGSSGLGLYSVKTNIEAQGGTVWLNSNRETGASFSFKLPLAP